MSMIDIQNVPPEMLAQVNPMSTSPYNAPIHQFQGAITTITDPRSELYTLELQLRSCVVDASGDVKNVGQPLLNEEGVVHIIYQVQSIVNRITIMSWLETNDIRMTLLANLNDSLHRSLLMNRIRYNIQNNDDRTIITSVCMNYAFVCAQRAWEKNEKTFWKGSQQEITTNIQGASLQKKKGLLGGMFGGK